MFRKMIVVGDAPLYGGKVLRDEAGDVDSQLSTLIHEVTHFDDMFSSTDWVYSIFRSRLLAGNDRDAAFKNADNFAGYIVEGISYGS